ncbi:glycosyltransferase [Candidatus Shapirobacteria bacterium]|nr:glycosyltransferase [Candidatus Shapirobacteria bacterium]
MTSISIVMSCYNEENNLKRGVLSELNDYISRSNLNWEVVITNDLSTDKSYELLLSFAKKNKSFRILNLEKKGGKPGGIWNSIQAAKYPYVLMTDIDQSTPISEFDKFLPFIKDSDIVIGSRGLHRNGNSFLRKIGGPVFLTLRRLVILPNIIDTQCGFKLLKTEVAKELFPHLQFFQKEKNPTGWRVSAFDVELLFMARKWGHPIKEVEVDWRNEDTSNTKGDDTSRYKKESVQMIREIIRVKRNDILGKYEK